jgi:hypothetical protein
VILPLWPKTSLKAMSPPARQPEVMDTPKNWAFRDSPLVFFSASKDANHYHCDGFFVLEMIL